MQQKHEDTVSPPTAASPVTAARVLAATAAFAVLHSALAGRAAKAAAAKILTGRHCNSLYRAFFNAQATVTSAALLLYVRQLPDRELYVVRGTAAALMRAGQASALLLFFDALRRVGVLRFSGASELMQIKGPIDRGAPELEGQGPSRDEHGALELGGAFLRSRHPLNLAPVFVLWLNPRMTLNLAAFSAAATVYFWAGSFHEERRLLVAYGDRYRAYVNSTVPFFFGLRTLTSRGIRPRLTRRKGSR